MAEVLWHMGPDRQMEDAANAAATEELVGDDEEILRFMDSADGYLLLMDSLSAALRQGWLDLASARHSMGASRVSSALFEHKEQPAATKLQVDYSADLRPSELKPHFALSKWRWHEESNSSNVVSAQGSTKPKLRYRGSEATPDGSSESDAIIANSSIGVDINSQVESARSKALSVFGALVSPKLRTTQVSLETALELIVELANSRSTMLSSFSRIKHINDESLARFEVQIARSKALSVFGALVSPKLRTTQVFFESALELIVELANSRSTMLSSFSRMKHINDESLA